MLGKHLEARLGAAWRHGQERRRQTGGGWDQSYPPWGPTKVSGLTPACEEDPIPARLVRPRPVSPNVSAIAVHASFPINAVNLFHNVHPNSSRTSARRILTSPQVGFFFYKHKALQSPVDTQ